MRISKATNKDLDSCAKISHIREFSFAYNATDGQVKKYLNEFLKNGIFLIAKENSKLLGFAVAEFTLGKFIWIDAIIVGKKYRRMGIGKKLFKIIESEARKKGYRDIYLVVPEFNKNSIKFYESLNMKKGNKCIEFYKK